MALRKRFYRLSVHSLCLYAVIDGCQCCYVYAGEALAAALHEFVRDLAHSLVAARL